MASDAAQIVLIIESYSKLAHEIEKISRNDQFLRPKPYTEQPTIEYRSDSRELTPYVDPDTPSWELRLDKPPRTGRWIFGSSEDPEICDFQLAPDQSSGVSRRQFSIYHNPNTGVLLIRNLSRLGTQVQFEQEFEVIRDTRVIPHNKPLPVRAGALQIQLKIPIRSDDIQTLHEKLRERFIESFDEILDNPSMPGDQTAMTVQLEKGNIDIVLRQEISQCTFGTVYTGVHRSTGDVYAVKRIDKDLVRKRCENAEKRLENERALANKVKHDNIVEFHQVIDEGDWITIIMEYAVAGDLHKQSQESQFTPEEVYLIAQQQCSAIAYLHDIDITHRDIKPGNILLCSRDPLVSKLADFGDSSLSPILQTYSGTKVYRAPELEERENDESYTNKVDVWSLGLVLVQLLEPEIEIRKLYLIPRRRDGTLAELCRSMLLISSFERANAQQCVKFIQANPKASWIHGNSTISAKEKRKTNTDPPIRARNSKRKK